MKGYDRQVWVRAAPEQAMCHTSVCAKTVRCGNAERCTRSEHNYAAGPSTLERSVAGKQRTHNGARMVYWEPITYKDLIILTEWMALQGYSAAQLAQAVREPDKYTEELRTVIRHHADLAAKQQAQDQASQQQAAAEFLAARAARHDAPAA